jgi:hypothetical protein
VNSTATEWMRDYVWPEIQAMMLNDAHFRLVLTARELTGKFNGPTAKLLQDGYLTYQMVAIRRLFDKRTDVISLRRALMEAEKEKPNFGTELNKLLDSLKACDHVCTQVNKYVAHTAKQDKSGKFVPWNMGMQHLDDSHQDLSRGDHTRSRYFAAGKFCRYHAGATVLLWGRSDVVGSRRAA